MKDAIGLLERREVGRFALDQAYMTLDDVDALLIGTGLTFPTFRMVKDGEGCSVEEISQSATSWGIEEVEGIVRPDAVHRKLRQGWTLVFDQVHRQWGPIAKLNRRFETGLGARSRIDVLVAPDGAVPPPHGPEMDRAVVCLHGQAGVRVEGVDHRLASGQALVVPMGVELETLPARGVTLIAVAAIQRVTWREVLMAALEAADAPIWHEPAQIRAEAPKAVSDDEKQTWSLCVEALQDELDAENALEAIVARIVESRMPVLTGQLAMNEAAIGENTPLRRRPECVYRILEEADKTWLVFHKTRIPFGVGARRVLELIAEAPLFRPGDLPGVPAEQRVPLCQALAKRGFLTTDLGR